jgi:glycogen operon protein
LDNENSWYDWSLLTKHADVHRLAKLLMARRVLRDVGPEHERMTLTQLIRTGIKGWHGVKLNEPDWSDHSHSIALSAELPHEAICVYLIFNAYWEPLEFELPRLESGTNVVWRRWIDTYLDSPRDIVEWQKAPAIPDRTYRVGSRSIVVLWTTHGSQTGMRPITRP